MYSNHDPPGSHSYVSLPPGIEPQGTPKDTESGSLLVDDVPPRFIEQSPVQYSQEHAHYTDPTDPTSQQQVEVVVAITNPSAHLAQLQTSNLPLNDKQMALFHTAVHYSPTPDNLDRNPRSPTPFHAAGQNTTLTQHGITLAPLLISLPTTYMFVNAMPYEPSDPGPTPVDKEQDQWETQTIENPDTPMNPPIELPEHTSQGPAQARFDDFLDYIRLPALPEDIFHCDTELT